MKILFHSCFLISFCLCLAYSAAKGQTDPSCDASSISLIALESTTDGSIATFSFDTQVDVESYQLSYQYTLVGEEQEEIIAIAPTLFTVKLAADTGQHRFTILNICLSGDIHTGSQLLLDLDNSSLDCPTPANLQIINFNQFSTSFQWDNDERALFWHVVYENADGVVQEFDTEEPFVLQELLNSNFHVFTIYTVCDEQALVNNVLVRQSPAIRFMIITVDDIKALHVPCSSLEKLTASAYLLYCTKHGHFGPNKERFLAVHSDCAPNATTPIINGLSELKAFPNPFCDQLQLSSYLTRAKSLEVNLLSHSGKFLGQLRPFTPIATGKTELNFSLSQYPAGMYWLQINDGETVQYLKVIKM